MTDTLPIHHVALTVRDLAVSVPWYELVLGAEPVMDEDADDGYHHTAYLMANGTPLGLHQHERTPPPERVSEHRFGLDHVGFGCEDRAESGRGRHGSTSWGSPTAASSTPTTAPG